jgi:hypothetical protein
MKESGGAFTGAIIGGLIVAIFVAYFSAANPYMFFESGCDPLFSENDYQFNLKIRNRGGVEAISNLCFTSNDVLFNSSNSSNLCFNNKRFAPMSTDLLTPYDIAFVPLNESSNISISVNVDCKSFVWGVLPKSCKGFQTECKYKKDRNYYELMN